jgi:radical SAM superfamily enzyme
MIRQTLIVDTRNNGSRKQKPPLQCFSISVGRFTTIIMYGIAGKGGSVDNAVATAKMINQFITNKVITMNLTVFSGTELNKMVERGDFIPADGRERLVEIRTLLENLEPKQQMIFDTTHPTNIINIKGTLPQDKERLINEVAKRLKVFL